MKSPRAVDISNAFLNRYAIAELFINADAVKFMKHPQKHYKFRRTSRCAKIIKIIPIRRSGSNARLLASLTSMCYQVFEYIIFKAITTAVHCHKQQCLRIFRCLFQSKHAKAQFLHSSYSFWIQVQLCLFADECVVYTNSLMCGA